jgi:hypothetical protein
MLTGRIIYVSGAGNPCDVVPRARTSSKISSLWVRVAVGNRPLEIAKGARAKTFQDVVAKWVAAKIDVLRRHVPWCATEHCISGEIDLPTRTVTSFSLTVSILSLSGGLGRRRREIREEQRKKIQFTTGL